MENTTNRNDAINFFRDMPQEMQIEIIEKMKRDAKKPPDQATNDGEGQIVPESAGDPIIC